MPVPFAEQEKSKDVAFPKKLEQGAVIPVVSAEKKQGFTSPPKAFTEDTLLSAMETAGNKEFEKDTEKKGLGTPATRAAILEKLVSFGYVERKGKQILPSAEGVTAIANIPDAEDKSVMRMQFYRPDKVSERFQKFALPYQPYQAREGFQWNTQKVFITDDEINAFLAGGGPYSDGRLATYSFFLTHTEKAERAAFLKDRYGVGGSSHALSRADDSHASYDGRGLELARGIYGKPDALVKLKWNQAAERVARLIDQSLYLKPADYSRMPNYEREQMANRVIGFYYHLPDEVERPFERELLNKDARKKLPIMLADPEQAAELLEKMDEKTIDEQRFVLMVNDQKPDLLPSIVVQSDGKFITSTASGFDNATVRKVRELLHHEKFLENGTAERARESGTEQNYNMIDGCVNNVPKKPRVIGGRVSVLDRLHIKQAERARKDNAQVQQQERTRKN